MEAFIKKSHDMELLLKTGDRGYPTDYLLSRLRGRRIKYRDSIADESPEGVWRSLLKEHQWVHLQMNRQLQDIFRPFFLYAELRTIVLCLRYKLGDRDKIRELLNFSLLSKDLKELLKGDLSVLATIGDIEDAFLPLSSKFRGLKEAFMKNRFREAEQMLANIYLEHSINSRPHPTIRDFFIYLIDSKNIIALYKCMRWGMLDYPSFIHGGSIKEERLRQIFSRRDIAGLLPIIRKLTGIMFESLNAANVENSLLKGITNFLKRFSRDPLCVGVILDYLWRCHIETINRSIIFHGTELNGDIIEAEMIH